jgi:hypothetical protein
LQGDCISEIKIDEDDQSSILELIDNQTNECEVYEYYEKTLDENGNMLSVRTRPKRTMRRSFPQGQEVIATKNGATIGLWLIVTGLIAFTVGLVGSTLLRRWRRTRNVPKPFNELQMVYTKESSETITMDLLSLS